MEAVSVSGEVPRDSTGGADARLAVRAVHPHTGPGLQWSSRPSSTSPSTPMPGPEASSLAMNTHVRDRLELRFKLGELRKERRHQRDVAEAIGRAAAEELIAVDCQAERVYVPTRRGWRGRHRGELAHEAQHILRRSQFPGYLMIKLPRPSAYVT